jgi:hypothetical protein
MFANLDEIREFLGDTTPEEVWQVIRLLPVYEDAFIFF